MSNPLKKIAKKVKKVFKKVVKTVKKVLKSDLFKIAVVAATVYFTAGAAAGYFGAAGAAGAGGAAATTTAAGAATAGTAAAGTAAAGASTAAGMSAAVNGGLAAAGITGVGGAAATTTAAGGLLGGITSGQALLGSAVLSTGGKVLSGYAEAEEQKKLKKELERNQSYRLNITDIYRKNFALSGNPEEAAANHRGAPIQEVAQNTPESNQSYYNAAEDRWAPVQKLANSAAPSPAAPASRPDPTRVHNQEANV